MNAKFAYIPVGLIAAAFTILAAGSTQKSASEMMHADTAKPIDGVSGQVLDYLHLGH